MALEFLIIGVTILIGYIALLSFEKTRISQVIILMGFGFLLGPVLGALDVSEQSIIISILPFISSLALIFLLFDGGIEFNLFSMARTIPKSILFTFTVFTITTFLVGSYAYFVLGLGFLYGALLGAVVGGISSAVVITMVEKTYLEKGTKSILTIESTITDALCIITAFIIVEMIKAQVHLDIGAITSLFLANFTIAIALAVAAAWIWINASNRFEHLKNYSYIMMIGLVFALFSITEMVKGNGGIAVFVFGIILGNAGRIGRFAKMKWAPAVSRTSRLFQEEVTFFVRTFFFVYVGLLFSIQYFTMDVLITSLILIILIGIARVIGQKIILGDITGQDALITITTMPRGLAAAILVAIIPVTAGIPILIPNFKELVFSVILLSNAIATIGIFLFDKEKKKNNKTSEKKKNS